MNPKSPGPKAPTGLGITEKGETQMGSLMATMPIWNITQDGSAEPVVWINHEPNPRFAIYDPLGDSNPADADSLSDDIVLDKETGLVWARDANLIGEHNWLDFSTMCRELELGNRMGWRLPAVEELSSLIDHRQADLALPAGHPFVNVQYGSGVNAYWTSTNHENPAAASWFANPWRGAAPHLGGLASKSIMGHAWPLRGGTGGNSWNW